MIMINPIRVLEDIYVCIGNFTNHVTIYNIIIFAIMWMVMLSVIMIIVLVIIYTFVVLTRLMKKCRYRTFNIHKMILESDGLCPICQESISGRRCYTTLCNHIYHIECLNKYVDCKIDNCLGDCVVECPVCRNTKILYCV